MFFIFHGSDVSRSYQALQKLLQDLTKKRPEASIFWLTPEELNANRLEEIIKSQTIFSGRYLVATRRLLANPEIRDLVLANREALKNSEHIFLLWEEKVEPKIISLFEDFAEKIKVYDLKKELNNEKSFNIFSLNDALGARDRKKLWLLFIEAKNSGLSAEEIYWRFFDQVKKMILVKSVSDLNVLTKAPFSHKLFYLNKLKKQAENFSLEELRQLIDQLLDAYRQNRMGKIALAESLEKIIMGL